LVFVHWNYCLIFENFECGNFSVLRLSGGGRSTEMLKHITLKGKFTIPIFVQKKLTVLSVTVCIIQKNQSMHAASDFVSVQVNRLISEMFHETTRCIFYNHKRNAEIMTALQILNNRIYTLQKKHYRKYQPRGWRF